MSQRPRQQAAAKGTRARNSGSGAGQRRIRYSQWARFKAANRPTQATSVTPITVG
jgi:hypothetical protein